MASTLVAHLETTWNRADGAAFGEAFADDSDFVDIRGVHHVGRAAIAAGHQTILDSIYREHRPLRAGPPGGSPRAARCRRQRRPRSSPRPPARHDHARFTLTITERPSGLADQRLPQHALPAYRLSAHDPLVASGDEPNRPIARGPG